MSPPTPREGTQLQSGSGDRRIPSLLRRRQVCCRREPDITAQVLRLWLLVSHDERPALDAEAAVRRIISSQVLSPQKEVGGGFVAGDAWFRGEPHDHTGQHVNSWICMFCVQALALAHNGGETFSPFLLV